MELSNPNSQVLPIYRHNLPVRTTIIQPDFTPHNKDNVENYGVYMIDCQPSDKATPGAVSGDEAEKLWNVSEKLVREKFAW